MKLSDQDPGHLLRGRQPRRNPVHHGDCNRRTYIGPRIGQHQRTLHLTPYRSIVEALSGPAYQSTRLPQRQVVLVAQWCGDRLLRRRQRR